jgi:hypothetical protein
MFVPPRSIASQSLLESTLDDPANRREMLLLFSPLTKC